MLPCGAPTVPRDRDRNSTHQRGLGVRESRRAGQASERAPLVGVTPPSVPPGGVYFLKLLRAQSVSRALQYRQIRRYDERSHARRFGRFFQAVEPRSSTVERALSERL